MKEKKVKMVGTTPYYKARQKLKNIIRFKVFSASCKNVCWRCKQLITKPEDMTLDHIIPWRNKGREEGLRLLGDKNNIAFAHPQCNVNDSVISGSGYRGVILHKRYRGKKWQAVVNANNKRYSLKYWNTPEQAAMRRDLFMFEYYQGACCLNFEQLREFYKGTIGKDYGFLEDEQGIKNLIGEKIQQ